MGADGRAAGTCRPPAHAAAGAALPRRRRREPAAEGPACQRPAGTSPGAGGGCGVRTPPARRPARCLFNRYQHTRSGSAAPTRSAQAAASARCCGHEQPGSPRGHFPRREGSRAPFQARRRTPQLRSCEAAQPTSPPQPAPALPPGDTCDKSQTSLGARQPALLPGEPEQPPALHRPLRRRPRVADRPPRPRVQRRAAGAAWLRQHAALALLTGRSRGEHQEHRQPQGRASAAGRDGGPQGRLRGDRGSPNGPTHGRCWAFKSCSERGGVRGSAPCPRASPGRHRNNRRAPGTLQSLRHPPPAQTFPGALREPGQRHPSVLSSVPPTDTAPSRAERGSAVTDRVSLQTGFGVSVPGR